MAKLVSWFSCGNNSAVASKLTLLLFPEEDVIIARCVVANEHPDNDRFHADCEEWFGVKILKLKSEEYRDCWEVWEDKKYLSGNKGAPCTTEMKKAVRWKFEKEWEPDFQVFGFSVDEASRVTKFRKNNPDISLLAPLMDLCITKRRCAEIVQEAGIKLPVMYGLGFSNNNCVGCVKASSPAYWARTRYYFPEQFLRMLELSRRFGCKLVLHNKTRIFLDEIPEDLDWNIKGRSEGGCGIYCNA